MRVLRTINNNVVICLDNNENEVVAFGKGIGFKKKNNDIIELSKIDRTYYKVKTEYVDSSYFSRHFRCFYQNN